MGNNGIFQDNNARTHWARIVGGYLQTNNVRRLEWSAVAGPKLRSLYGIFWVDPFKTG